MIHNATPFLINSGQELIPTPDHLFFISNYQHILFEGSIIPDKWNSMILESRIPDIRLFYTGIILFLYSAVSGL